MATTLTVTVNYRLLQIVESVNSNLKHFVQTQTQLDHPRRRGLALLFLAIVTAVYVLVVLLAPPRFYDEGLIVSGAQRILQGQHPYVDFNSGYPPGQFYTIALVFRIFGSSLLTGRIWDFVWRLAIIGAAYWLAHELAGEQTTLLPLMCCAALAGGVGFPLYPMISATLPCLCALSCALRFVRTQNLRWIFGAGLLLSCTAVFRHDLAACVGIVVLGSVLRNRRATFSLLTGMLLVAGPVIAYLLIEIPPHILQETFLEFPKLNATARHLPILSSPFFPGHLLLTLAIIGFAADEARRVPAGRRAPVLMMSAVAGLTLILATQRLDMAHAFPSVIICLIILAGYVPSNIARPVLITLATFLFGIFPLLTWAAQLRALTNTPASLITRAGGVRIPLDQARAVQYVQDHLPAGEKLYVGTTSHSRIWVNDALFPFLADRPQATRHYMWIPGLTNSVPVQSQIVHELEINGVQYVVLFNADRSSENNLSSLDSGVTRLDDYLNVMYGEVAVFGRYHILKRRQT